MITLDVKSMKQIIFDKLGEKETALLLRAFDYDVDSEDFVLDTSGKRIASEEIPSKYLKLNEVALTPGSLKVIEGSSEALSRFIREKLEPDADG